MNRICNTCNIEIDKNNYIKDRTACKSCYNKSRRKDNNNTLTTGQQPKIENVNNNNNKNRTPIIGFSNCGKTYLMNLFLHQKQEPICIKTKSLNQYPNIKAQTSDEIQPLNEYENSVVVFDDMLLSKQGSNIDQYRSVFNSRA